MIGPLLLIGVPLLLLAWLVGLPSMWRGAPKLSLWASGIGILLGLVTALSGMMAPRHDNFWTGNAGTGDGFGLIGLFVAGGLLAGVAFILFIATVTIATIRSDRTEKKASE